MAIIKCKMCGGSLEVQEGMTVCECEYCGTQQTLPKLDDERKINLYDRANHFRRNNEYDKASNIYEQILNGIKYYIYRANGNMNFDKSKYIVSNTMYF